MVLKRLTSFTIVLVFLIACSDSDSVAPQTSDSLDDVSCSSSKSPSSSSNKRRSSSSLGKILSSSSSKNSTGTEQGRSKQVEKSSSSSSGRSSSAKSSSSSVLSCSSEGSWNWEKPKESYFNPDVEYGSITDERDGKTYKTVKINNLTWLAENLNYADSAKTPSLKSKSWCYDDVPSHCDVLGRLYTWAAAIDSVAIASDKKNPQNCGYGKQCVMPSRARGVCPFGWHLPTVKEFQNLGSDLGDDYWFLGDGEMYKSTTGWDDVYNNNGTNVSGFTALPAGIRSFRGLANEAYFVGVGLTTAYWSLDEYWTTDAFKIGFMASPYDQNVCYEDKRIGLSIRCVMDYDTIQGWSWDVPKEDRFNPNIVYDSIIDERDNKVYKTVKIGDQTWMAENLNYADSIRTPSLIGHSACYDNDSAKCNKTGRLYLWEAAIDSVALATDETNPQECGFQRDCILPTRVQGICPKGWHLPDSTEWSILIAYAGESGNKFKSTSGWNAEGPPYDHKDQNGVDAYGFSALPAGYFRDSSGGYSWDISGKYSEYAGIIAHFWGVVAGGCCDVTMCLSGDDVVSLENLHKHEAFSIRCIKD